MGYEILDTKIIQDIRDILLSSRTNLAQTVNTTMVQTYWHIGKIIVEDEQKGSTRAAYGKKQLDFISQKLSHEFGKGFDTRNLRNMRKFYSYFPIWNAVSTKLSWTHYRRLISLDNLEK